MQYANDQHYKPDSIQQSAATSAFDPLRLCIFTTIALLSWIFSPAVIVTLMSSLGLWAYAHAWRRGLRRSQCVLRHPLLIMTYLGTACLLGLAFTVDQILSGFQ